MFLWLDPEEAMSSRLLDRPYGADLRERVLAATGDTSDRWQEILGQPVLCFESARAAARDRPANAGPTAQSRSASSEIVL